MKKYTIIALGFFLTSCATSISIKKASLGGGVLKEKDSDHIEDVWIKTVDPPLILDSLVVKLYGVTNPKVVAIPGSDSIKFQIRTNERDVVFLESKKSKKKIAFRSTKNQWGKLLSLE